MPYKVGQATPMPVMPARVGGQSTMTPEMLGNSINDLAKWTESELKQVSRSSQELLKHTVQYAPPPKQQTGTVVYADGTHWNPGQGEGPYVQKSDGSWTPQFAAAGTLTDAPSNTNTYGRKGGAWVTVLNLTDGGTVTGNMTFNGSAAFAGATTCPTPTAPTQVANKAYVDGLITTAAPYPGFIFGLTLSTAGASATFSVAAGQATDSTDALLMKLAASLNKTTSAFAAGTGNGALDTGAISAAAWYHVFLISNAGGTTVDVLISLSPTAPTMPPGYTLFRRIGSMKTSASQWIKFTQFGPDFWWDTGVNEMNNVTLTGSATITQVLAGVPTGVRMTAKLTGIGQNVTTAGHIQMWPADLTGGTNDFLVQAYASASSFSSQMMTDTNASVKIQNSSTANATGFFLYTLGWNDRRGQDA